MELARLELADLGKMKSFAKSIQSTDTHASPSPSSPHADQMLERMISNPRLDIELLVSQRAV